MEAAALYSWPTAESVMRLARRKSLPRLPGNLEGLAILFEDGELSRFQCCEASIFRGCVRDVDNNKNVVFACTHLIRSVLNNDIRDTRRCYF